MMISSAQSTSSSIHRMQCVALPCGAATQRTASRCERTLMVTSHMSLQHGHIIVQVCDQSSGHQ